MASGQLALAFTRHLLEVQPPGSCLLLDGVTSRLDDAKRKGLVPALLARDMQTVMTFSGQTTPGSRSAPG